MATIQSSLNNILIIIVIAIIAQKHECGEKQIRRVGH